MYIVVAIYKHQRLSRWTMSSAEATITVTNNNKRKADTKKKPSQPPLPIQMQYVIRDEAKRRKLNPREALETFDASFLANAIIKEKALDRKMHALAIARRLQYCMTCGLDASQQKMHI